MLDGYLIAVLGAFLVYSVCGSVIGIVGPDLPGELESTFIHWGWLIVPAVAVTGMIRGIAGRVGYRRVLLAPGDHVLYTMPKQSRQPGPRARNIRAHRFGEGYSYIVPKLWTVERTHADGTVDVVTPGGKHHELRRNDPHMHKVGRVRRLFLEKRLEKHFPSLENAA